MENRVIKASLEGRERIFLIDGMSQVFRAYYAIRGLSTSHGVPTNATYGFITMLRKLIEDEKPTYLGVVFDPEGPTVRHLQFQDYKAHRRPTPPDLIAQLPDIRRFCEAMHIPVLVLPEYEADDVIGTLTARAERIGLQTVIVSIDKDMFQLVSDSTLVLDTRQDYVLFDRERVVEKMGVPPEQIVDLLGLRGDSSDNIPGAPGIGEKGALDLIRRFGSIEACLDHWQEVERKAYRESLRDNASLIRQSRDLATIHRDLPMALELDALKVGPPDLDGLAELYRELEFTSLLKALFTMAEPAPDNSGSTEVRASVETHQAAGTRDLASAWKDAVDSGPTFLLVTGTQVPGLAVCGESGQVHLLPADGDPAEFVAAWRSLAGTRLRKITYDLKSAFLAAAPHARHPVLEADDVMLMAYLVNPLSNDYLLPALASEWLGRTRGAAHASPAEDAHWVSQLAPKLLQQLDHLGLRELYETIELPLVGVLADMEIAGVRVDTGLLARLSEELEQELVGLRRQIFTLAGTEFNLDSPKQLGEILFEKLNLPVLKRTRKTKGYSTDQEVLEELAVSFEVPRLMLDYRQMTKLKSTYIESLPKLVRADTGRVHTSYNQTVAATGRLSSSNPNLQNIPIRTELGRKIRGAFVAEPGHRFVAADYSQIELRVMAHLSEDPAMIDAFLKDQDIHERTASEVFGIAAQMHQAEYRRRAKVINFGILYGLSAFGLAKQLQISRAEAQRFIDSYFARYRGIRSWLDKTLLEARATGQVRTLFGRVRPVPELRGSDKNVKSFGERIAVNTPIQGTAADLIKLAMVQLHKRMRESGLASRIILQVHDELVLECPESEVQQVADLVKEVMEGVYTLKVPLRVDVGIAANWKDLK